MNMMIFLIFGRFGSDLDCCISPNLSVDRNKLVSATCLAFYSFLKSYGNRWWSRGCTGCSEDGVRNRAGTGIDVNRDHCGWHERESRRRTWSCTTREIGSRANGDKVIGENPRHRGAQEVERVVAGIGV